MKNSNVAGNLLPIIQNIGEPTIDSRIIADELGIQHKNTISLIRTHLPTIEKDFGKVAFQTLPSKNTGSVQKETVANLNEGQSLFVATLAKNSKQAVEVKSKIVKSFLFFRQTAYELASKNHNLIQIAENVQMSSIPNDKHVFFVTTKELARAACMSVSTINANKHRFKQLLFEDIHFINDFVVKDSAKNLDYKTTVWTQKGVIELTKHMRVGNAVAFRDWSDRVQNIKPQNLALRETSPKNRKHNRLTPERIISIMATVSKIQDASIREELSDKITEGYV